jgi:predicted transcriptional regulator
MVKNMFVLQELLKKGIGRFGQAKSILSIGLGCEAKYAKDFVYTENININDKVNRNSYRSIL